MFLVLQLLYLSVFSVSFGRVKIISKTCYMGVGFLELTADDGLPKYISLGTDQPFDDSYYNFERFLMICNPTGTRWSGDIEITTNLGKKYRSGVPLWENWEPARTVCLSMDPGKQNYGECVYGGGGGGSCIYYSMEEHQQFGNNYRMNLLKSRDLYDSSFPPNRANGRNKIYNIDVHISSKLKHGYSQMLVATDSGYYKDVSTPWAGDHITINGVNLYNRLEVCIFPHEALSTTVWTGGIAVKVGGHYGFPTSGVGAWAWTEQICLSSKWMDGACNRFGDYDYENSGWCMYATLSELLYEPDNNVIIEDIDGIETYKAMNSGYHEGATIRITVGNRDWSGTSELVVQSDLGFEHRISDYLYRGRVIIIPDVEFDEMIIVCSSTGDPFSGAVEVKVEGWDWPNIWFRSGDESTSEICLSDNWGEYITCVHRGVHSYRSGKCVNFNLAEFRNMDHYLRTDGYVTKADIRPYTGVVGVGYINQNPAWGAASEVDEISLISDLGVDQIMRKIKDGDSQEIKFSKFFKICNHKTDIFRGYFRIRVNGFDYRSRRISPGNSYGGLSKNWNRKDFFYPPLSKEEKNDLIKNEKTDWLDLCENFGECTIVTIEGETGKFGGKDYIFPFSVRTTPQKLFYEIDKKGGTIKDKYDVCFPSGQLSSWDSSR